MFANFAAAVRFLENYEASLVPLDDEASIVALKEANAAVEATLVPDYFESLTEEDQELLAEYPFWHGTTPSDLVDYLCEWRETGDSDWGEASGDAILKAHGL